MNKSKKQMQLVKFLLATTFLIIFSCSNLGEQSSEELKISRGGDAFQTVFQQVLKEDKALANFFENFKERNDGISNYSFSRGNWKAEDGPESFINMYYQNVTQQISSIADSTDRKILSDLTKANELLFRTHLQAKIDIGNEIAEIEAQLQKRSQKLKIKKTLAYMKDYQEKQTFDLSEITKERDELKELLTTLETLE